MREPPEPELVASESGEIPPAEIPLELRRLRNPGRPPVLLLHGASAQHETFLIPRGRSLAEFLWEKGYEPWLLDWRGSCRVTDALGAEGLQAKRRVLDFDHAAREDVPWALARIREVRRREEGREPLVDALGHCMGAGVLAQAIAAGNATAEQSLARVVLLTIGLFYEPPADGRLKSQDHVLDRLWQQEATASIDPRVPERGWPRELREIYRNWAPSLRPHPHAEGGSSHELCDRVSFMYGTPYRERNLVPEIHGVRTLRFARGAVEPGRGERLCGVEPGGSGERPRGPGRSRMGFVSQVRRESGSWRDRDAQGSLDLSGAVGTFRDGDELEADDGLTVAVCRGQVDDRPAELCRQFGAIPLRMYLQGAKNVRRRWAGPFDADGHCEDWIGSDAWHRFHSLPAVGLITGARNQLWHRDSIDRMAEWLRRGPRQPRFEFHKEVLAEYGHQDLLWGMQAYEQVFPIVLECLGGPLKPLEQRPAAAPPRPYPSPQPTT